MNQCDGCRRGLPTRTTELGVGWPIHYGSDPWDLIGCTAHLYRDASAPERPAGCGCPVERVVHVLRSCTKHGERKS